MAGLAAGEPIVDLAQPGRHAVEGIRRLGQFVAPLDGNLVAELSLGDPVGRHLETLQLVREIETKNE